MKDHEHQSELDAEYREIIGPRAKCRGCGVWLSPEDGAVLEDYCGTCVDESLREISEAFPD